MGTAGCIQQMVRLHEVLPGFKGPDLHLDFDAEGELVGIEILESAGE